MAIIYYSSNSIENRREAEASMAYKAPGESSKFENDVLYSKYRYQANKQNMIIAFLVK